MEEYNFIATELHSIILLSEGSRNERERGRGKEIFLFGRIYFVKYVGDVTVEYVPASAVISSFVFGIEVVAN